MADWAEIKNSVTEMFAIVSFAFPQEQNPTWLRMLTIRNAAQIQTGQ